MQENKENLINRKAVVPGLPVTPLIPTPGVGGRLEDVNPNMSVAETWMDALSRTGPTGVESIPLSSFYIGDRYDKTRPGTDFEEAHAQQQHWSSKMVNSLGKMGVLATTTFTQSTVGAVNGLINIINDKKFSSFYDNEFNKTMAGIVDTYEDKWANYYTAAERDANWYSPRKIFSANFLWDGIVKNLGFSLGTIASGYAFSAGLGALSRTLSGIPKVSKLVSIGKAADVLDAQEKVLTAAATAGRAGAMNKEIVGLYNKFAGQYSALTTANKVLVAGLATSGEAAFEAYHNLNEYRDRKIEEYKAANGGMAPTGSDLDEINNLSASVGNWSYMFNVGILSATNYIQFPKIFGSSYKIEKGLANTRKIGDIVRDGSKYVAKPVKGNALIRGIKNVAPYTFSASEAFEEGAQYAITLGTQDFFDKKHNDLPTDFITSVMEGVSGTLGTNEGMENVLIGGLSGALMLGPGKFRDSRERTKNTRDALREGGRFTGEAGINTAGFSEFTKETHDSVRRGAYIQQQREQAIEDGNIVDSKDLEADYIMNYLIPRIKYGRYDLVKSDIQDFKQMASTEEGFAELQKQGVANESDTREAFINRLILFENTAQNAKTVYENINLRYGGAINEKGERLYPDDVIDKMVYATSKVADYDTRISSLSSALSVSGIPVNMIIKDMVLGNPESFNEAVAKIKTLDLIDEKKTELGQLLEDVVEMSLRRVKFLQEYEQIKANPSKFKENKTTEPIADVPADQPAPEIIKIKTKKGEKDVEVGVEYFLGRVVEYDKDGNEVYRAPRITILGENEDGTVKIKTSNGNIRDISKSELEGYSLGRVDSTLSNKKAKFFMDNWNTVFEFNFGKGNKVKGRLEYSPDGRTLLFKYKDKRGKIREVEVTGDQFVAKKGYKQAMITPVGEYTAVQKQSLEEMSKEKDERRQQKREERLNVLNELFDEVSDKQTKVQNLIKQKKDELSNIENELISLRKRIEEDKDSVDKRAKGFRFKPTIRKAFDTSMRLTRMKEQIEREIQELEAQNEQIEFNLTYVADMAQNIDELPTESRHFLEDLNDQVLELEILGEETAKQTSSLTRLTSIIEKAIDEAFTFLHDIVSEFNKQYPKVPRILGQEWIDFLKVNPNFLKLKPNYKSDLQALDEMVAQVEDTDININQEKLSNLISEIQELQDTLALTEKEIIAKNTILDKFADVAKRYKEKKAQEQNLKSDTLIKDALGVADKGNIHTKNPSEDDSYEPFFKKAINFIWRSTMGVMRMNKPHQLRANKFGFNLNKFSNRDNIRGVYITSDNQHLIAPGLMEFIESNADGAINKDEVIALVMVDDNGVLVGENGQPLTLEQLSNPLDHLIFQVMPLSDLKWSAEFGGESMFRKEDESRAGDIREQYAEFRNKIFNESKSHQSKDDVELHTIDASFGHPRFDKIKDENGKEVNDYSKRTPVTKTGLVTENDMTEKEVIFIPTTNNIVDQGTTRYEGDNIGRPFLFLPNGAVPLQNRHHTKKEASTIFDVLVQLAKNMIDPNIGAKHKKSIQLYEWLETVVYWGIPTTPEGKRKPAAYNSVFWEKNDKGDFVLSLSGKGTSFIFTPSSLLANQDLILGMLEKMYMNVRNNTIKEINEPYNEIIAIDSNGDPIYREWVNYQTFLLSDKIVTFDSDHADNGKSRTDVPLTSILSPLVDENDVNRTGIYFYTDDNINEINIPEEGKKKPPVKITPDVKGAPVQQAPIDKTKMSSEYVYDGKTKNEIIGSTGRKIVFTVNEEGVITVLPEGDILVILNDTVERVTQLWTQEGKISPDKFRVGQDKEILDEAKKQIKEIVRNRITQAKQDVKDKKPVQEKPEAPQEKEDEKFKVSDLTADNEEAKKLLNDIRNKAKKDNNEDYYRVVNERESEKFEKEDWPKVEKWLRANFSGLPVYRVKNIIKATNGRLAWGMFQDAALYVYEAAEAGTTYHEVFEAVWKMFTSPTEQQGIVNEFKQRRGVFTDRPTGNAVKYSEADAQQIKEQLAEEFREYVLNKKLPPKPEKRTSLISGLFNDIVNFIKKFILRNDVNSKVEEMFRNISSGKYKNAFESQLSLVNSGVIDVNEAQSNQNAEFSMIPSIPGKQVNDIVDNMVYHTIFDLIKKDESLFNLSERKIQKTDVYNTLQRRVLEDIVIKSNNDAAGLSPEHAKLIIDRADTLALNVIKSWDNIISKFEDSLTKYDIQFDENDLLAVEEYEKSKQDPFIEGNKIDHLKKANTAIKLLLATMIQTDENGRPVKSSVGGPVLIPLSRTAASLYNKLHNSRTPEDMIYKLREMAENDPNYRGLYRRLTKKDYSERINKDGNKVLADLSKLDTTHSLRLLASFYSSFRKQNPEVLVVTIFDNGETAVGDAHFSTFASQMREDYINSIISKARSNTSYLRYDKAKKAFVGDPVKVKGVRLDNLGSMVAFLDKLGVQFELEDVNKLRGKQLKSFKEAVSGIRESIANSDEIASISGSVLSINGRLLELANIQANIKNPEFDVTLFNINRERIQAFIGTNPASDLYDFITQLESFTPETVNGTQYSYLVNDSFAQGSNVLERMFSENGNKKEGRDVENLLRVAYVSGTDNQQRNKQKESSKLNYKERLIQEINLNLEGYYLNLVPGDASMEWAIYLGLPVSEKNIRSGGSMIDSVFKKYFISEVNLAREGRQNIAANRNSKELRFLKSVLGDTLHNKIINSSKFNNNDISAEDIYNSNESAIKSAIRNYISTQNSSLKSTLEEYGVLGYSDSGYTLQNTNIKESLTEDELNTKLTFLNINFAIANIELHKLLYADPYQYKDELKRIKNFNSPRQPIINSSPLMNAAFHKTWNRGFEKGHPGWTDFHRDFFRSVVYNDVLAIVEDLVGYSSPFKETDGGGIISFPAHRNFRIRNSSWNDQEEAQFKHDMEYEKLVNEDATEEALVEFNKSNPKVRSAYTPIKPIVAGAKGNSEYNSIVLDKFALYPMSRRLADDIARAGNKTSSNLSQMYDKMRKEDIDYMVFDNSRKVGAHNQQNTYNDEGKLNSELYPEDAIVNIPFSIMSTQADVPSHDDYSVTRGSQITKLVTMDYMDAGVPIDYMVENKSISERYKQWNTLTEEQKENTSPVYKEIRYNQRLLEAQMEVGYRNLLNRFGIRESYNRGKGQMEYTINDFSKTVETLRAEMLKREVSDNIVHAIDSFREGNTILEATPAYHQIRNILYSIADKEVISPKVNGSMKVQISSALMEETRVRKTEINGKPVYVSDVLDFYKKDGKQVAEIMIARWFDSSMSDAELLEYLNTTEEGQRILAGVAFRIPTQKQNSIEAFVIKRFLPQEFGDAVVVPSAIVQKTGSDFDIDKLTIYLKNVISKIGRLPSLITLKNDTNSTLTERYAQYVLHTVGKDTKKYAKFLSQGRIAELKEQYKGRFDELQEIYKEAIAMVKESTYSELTNTYKDIRDSSTEQDLYIAELFDIGKGIFRKLPDAAKNDFYDVRDWLKNNDINGPEEIVQYMALAQDMININEFGDDVTQTLTHLVENYQQELAALGMTDTSIKEAREAALMEFRENREKGIEGVRDFRRAAKKGIYKEIKEEYDSEFIDELARIEELMTVEQFGNLPILEQNTKKALENEYIESLERIVSNPLNFERLTSPNSAADLQAISKEIAELTVGSTFDYKDVGNMLNRTFMSRLRHAFVTGKYAIGISAVNQTNHSLNQRQLVYIDPSRSKYLSEEDKYWLNDMLIKFKEHNRINIEGKGNVSTLSMKLNADGKYISDIVSQFIDGYVDISNGPWIIELGATPNVVPTWFFLIKMGVPIETVAYFMNQPIIRDYLQSIENQGYSWLFMSGYIDAIKDKYKPAKSTQSKFDYIPNRTTLRNTVGKNVKQLNDYQKEQQVFMIDEFMKYVRMASHLFYITQGSNFDTATFNDPYLVFKKFEQLKKARQTIISDVDDILSNSFVGKLADTIHKVRESLSQILTSDQKRVRNVIEAVIEPYINQNDRDFVKVARKAVSDLFDYAVQIDKNLQLYIKKIMIDNGGVAKEVETFMKEIADDPTHPLFYNHIVGEAGILRPIYSRKAGDDGVNNVRVRGLQNKVYDQNTMIYAFREMRDYLKGKNKLYDRLILLSVLQSGLSTSNISFTSVIPFEDFTRVYQDTLSRIGSISYLQKFVDLNVFKRNNWSNDDIVPSLRARLIDTVNGPKYNPAMEFLPNNIKAQVKSGNLPHIVKIWANTKEANHSHIVYMWEKYDELLPSDWRKIYKMSKWDAIKKIKSDMRAKGDYSYINKGLFEKVVNETTGEPLTTKYTNKRGEEVIEYIYKAINAWGDGHRANEFYQTQHQSIIDNGFVKVNEVANSKIIGAFKGGKQQEIDMQQDNIDKVLSGEKTTTLRTYNISSGIYNIGGKEFSLTNRGLLSIQEAGGVAAISKSEAFSPEGPKFEYTKDFLAGKRKLYVIDIAPFSEEIIRNQQDNNDWKNKDNNCPTPF